ncbi:hypothetical protein Gohar_014940 [Gossypium harknessii]|uniref:Uncharacterized protein n=1 Tax=Gossypium harknessii TaxID=34285 RepID=A0A7J9FY78_9ROSI|nr:hypothetical protein [Gossypium harknessii]
MEIDDFPSHIIEEIKNKPNKEATWENNIQEKNI